MAPSPKRSRRKDANALPSMSSTFWAFMILASLLIAYCNISEEEIRKQSGGALTYLGPTFGNLVRKEAYLFARNIQQQGHPDLSRAKPDFLWTTENLDSTQDLMLHGRLGNILWPQ
ncbi:chemokine-like protein TAFA-5 isoform X4 [Sarcophilus harrisii]|uniref:chemokine-like protein TAFA-5 isoform X4 n=1 Tax=Sarcophilus harrisii TaxID=9305 RepID=UPI001301ADA8|nr:chemokine-like protein TAFA-5 isoform X4 [Sarcophilus harrisii]